MIAPAPGREELMDELLGFYRAAHEDLLVTEARLTRKVASLQRKLADADANEAEVLGELRKEIQQRIEAQLVVRDRNEEIARLSALPPSPPAPWNVSETVRDQAAALGQANKDRDAWAARCENAENLLRGYFQGVGSTDPSKAEELKQRTRLHFRGIGEGT